MQSPAAANEDATIRCIEAGMVPEGVLALYPLDPIRRGRRILGFGGATFAAALVAEWVSKASAPVLFGLALTLALAGVRLTPTVDDDDEDRRRPAVVVTATAIVKLEPKGPRTWRFAELARAEVSAQAERRDMVLVGRDGSRTLIDCAALQSGERLIEEVGRNLPVELL
jgi:hypothetical protein